MTREESAVDAANRVVRKRLDALSDRESAVSASLHAMTVLAAEHGMPTDRTALDNVEHAVEVFRDQAEIWIEGHGDLLAARRQLDAATERAARSRTIADERETDAAQAESEHRRLAAELDIVERTVGVEYRQVLAELSELRVRRSDLVKALDAARAKALDLAVRLGELAERRKTDTQARDGALVVRDTAAGRFRHLAGGTLSAESGFPDPDALTTTLTTSEGVRAALDAARSVASIWPNVPHEPNNLGDALHRLSESVHECRTALSARSDLDLEAGEDMQMFTALVDGIRVGAAELLAILRADAEQSRLEITERERQLFDQTLTGDTRRHLAARIRQASELVDAMDERLERVRTASNVAVRLVWQVAPDLPAATRAARDLLLKDPVRLTEADRESLHQFFRAPYRAGQDQRHRHQLGAAAGGGVRLHRVAPVRGEVGPGQRCRLAVAHQEAARRAVRRREGRRAAPTAVRGRRGPLPGGADRAPDHPARRGVRRCRQQQLWAGVRAAPRWTLISC